MPTVGPSLDALIPVAMVLAVAAIAIAAIHYRYRVRRDVLKAIERSMAANPALDPGTIAAIAEAVSSRRADLRRGMILIGLALGGCVIGLTVGGKDGPVFFAASSFPAILGAIFVMFHILDRRINND